MMFQKVGLCEDCVSFYWKQNASILKQLRCKEGNVVGRKKET